jgi:hypothetical protein
MAAHIRSCPKDLSPAALSCVESEQHPCSSFLKTMDFGLGQPSTRRLERHIFITGPFQKSRSFHELQIMYTGQFWLAEADALDGNKSGGRSHDEAYGSLLTPRRLREISSTCNPLHNYFHKFVKAANIKNDYVICTWVGAKLDCRYCKVIFSLHSCTVVITNKSLCRATFSWVLLNNIVFHNLREGRTEKSLTWC